MDQDSYLNVYFKDQHLVIEMDKSTASDLRNVLQDVGEHQAAGAEIPPITGEMATRLGNLLQELWKTVN